MVLRYLSLFSGVGGFELGIQNVGVKPQNSTNSESATSFDSFNPLCIGYSEIDKYAIETYKSHFKEHKNYGDVTTINERQLPDFDLLVGGFPCQAFSVAGKRKGFDDTRGTLFFDIARILKHKRPRHLVLENVKGLLSHDSGKTFQTILGVLSDLGYGVEWQVLNGKRWIPQNRERIIIVGHLRGECGRKVLPFREVHKNRIRERFEAAGVNNPSRGYEVRRDGLANALRAAEMGSKNIIATRQPLRYLNRNQKNIEGDYAFTVDASNTAGIKIGTRIRRLTPLECERLMGWPDNWTIGSDTQRYKQCGNGIIAPMVTAIIEKMEGCL